MNKTKLNQDLNEKPQPLITSWKAHQHCIICGAENPVGLKIHYSLVDKLSVEATWVVNEDFQGYNGLLQGGITAAILDSAMANCLHLNGIEAYTAELNIRYLNPIKIGAKLEISATLIKSRKHLHWTTASIYSENKSLDSAEAKFISEKQIH